MFKENELVFVSWTCEDWKNNQPKPTDYHLARYQGGVITTSCGMVIFSTSAQPSYANLIEPEFVKICSVCSSRAAEFSKKHFGGVKLKFKKSGIKNTGKGTESSEEAYRQQNTGAESWKLRK